jgi:AraC-like DNA-binding protein
MWVNWSVYRPRITVTGASSWPKGDRRGWRGSLRDHDILFFSAGTGDLKGRDNRHIPLHHGTCLWLTPGRIYEANQDPVDACQNYFIHFELLDREGHCRPHDEPVPPEWISNIDTVAVESLFRRITTLLPYYRTEQRGRFSLERIAVAESLLLSLLMDLDFSSHPSQPEPSFGLRQLHNEAIMRIVADIQQRPDDPRTVQSMADDAGYSAAHFSRVFHAVLGHWPEQFLIEQRIERAKVLLTTSSLSVFEIAEKLGYKQQSFFSTQFKLKVGSSPRAYREARRMDGKPTRST